jgi:hypothetical protein
MAHKPTVTRRQQLKLFAIVSACVAKLADQASRGERVRLDVNARELASVMGQQLRNSVRGATDGAWAREVLLQLAEELAAKNS